MAHQVAHLHLLPPVAVWQTWPEGDPTDEQLESLTDDEYDNFVERQSRLWERGRIAHPSNHLEDQ